MYLIIGLGNPGNEYANTKHNIGFIAVDYMSEKHDIRVNKIKHKALIGQGRICGEKVLLVKPQTYMNLSGESVREIADYYKVPDQNILVIYDDIDIPMGSLRIRKKGSAGSHNGMKSIITCLGNDDFPRFRIGIGGDRGNVPLKNYVISGFSSGDIKLMEDAVIETGKAVEETVESGIDTAMQNHNKIIDRIDKNEKK